MSNFTDYKHEEEADQQPREQFKQYRRRQVIELRPYVPGEDMAAIVVGWAEEEAGSPKAGDMIARDPSHHEDQWLVSASEFIRDFEPF